MTSAPPVAATDSFGDDSIYAKYGFRIRSQSTLLREQSLANVQELSSPQALPGPYYQSGSNYALLLLGGIVPHCLRPVGPSQSRVVSIMCFRDLALANGILHLLGLEHGDEMEARERAILGEAR